MSTSVRPLDAHPFTAAADRYTMTALDGAIELVIDHLRRDHHDLVGELEVRCTLPGAYTFRDPDSAIPILAVGSFNLSSPKVRSERARLLATRVGSKGPGIDWIGLLEEFAQRVIVTERQGEPALWLDEVPRTGAEATYTVEGLTLLRQHPTIGFGDGATLKSLLALYVDGCLARQGVRVGYFDWELDGGAHADRLAHLFDAPLPRIRYVQCARPLVFEVDRLRRIVRDDALDFAVFDSVAFATNGPPEAAEHAAAYFRAVRQLGIGSFHVAHVNKSDNGDQKPFGSAFWHNGARATWFFKLAEPTGPTRTLGLFNRKMNLGPLHDPVGLGITFTPHRIRIVPVPVSSVRELAAACPLWQQMQLALADEPKPIAVLARELSAKVDSITRTARRHPQKFQRVTRTRDGIHRLALVRPRAAK